MAPDGGAWSWLRARWGWFDRISSYDHRCTMYGSQATRGPIRCRTTQVPAPPSCPPPRVRSFLLIVGIVYFIQGTKEFAYLSISYYFKAPAPLPSPQPAPRSSVRRLWPSSRCCGRLRPWRG